MTMLLGQINIGDFVAWKKIELAQWQRASNLAAETNWNNDPGPFKSSFHGPMPAFPDISLEAYLEALTREEAKQHD